MPATVDPLFHQTCFLQHLEVLRDRAEGDFADRFMDLPRGALAVPDDAQDLPAPRSRQRLEHSAHDDVLVETKTFVNRFGASNAAEPARPMLAGIVALD